MKTDGCVETFDGRYFRGWLQNAAGVDLYVDDELYASAVVLKPGDSGQIRFVADSGERGAMAETPTFALRFAGADRALRASPRINGIVNSADLAYAFSFADYLMRNPDTPCPPSDYLYYIGSGEAGRTGF